MPGAGTGDGKFGFQRDAAVHGAVGNGFPDPTFALYLDDRMADCHVAEHDLLFGHGLVHAVFLQIFEHDIGRDVFIVTQSKPLSELLEPLGSGMKATKSQL
jgi:hypothetical protein